MPKSIKPLWARNIMMRRLAAGYKSAEAFSQHVKISSGTYRDIEAGVSEGRWENRVAIAKALGCAISDLYKESSAVDPGKDFTSVAEFLSAFSALSSYRKNFLLAVVFRDESYISGEPRLVQSYRTLFPAHGK